MLRLWKRLRAAATELSKLQLQVYAANASFFVLISAFPAVMLLVTLLKFLPLEAEDVLQLTESVLPAATQELAGYLVRDLYSHRSITGTALVVSLLTALWSASKGAMATLRGINAAYRTQDTRGWLRQRLLCMLYIVGLLVAMILTLALHAFWKELQALLSRAFPPLDGVVSGVMSVRFPIVLLALVVFFLGIYYILPHRRLRLWRQLPGALLAAGGWLGFSSVYSFYLEHSSGFSALYGSLTAVVVTMLWLYFCMCIVFFGATLNQWLERTGFWLRRRAEAEPH